MCSNDEDEDGIRHELDPEGGCGGSLIQSACGKTRRWLVHKYFIILFNITSPEEGQPSLVNSC